MLNSDGRYEYKIVMNLTSGNLIPLSQLTPLWREGWHHHRLNCVGMKMLSIVLKRPLLHELKQYNKSG